MLQGPFSSRFEKELLGNLIDNLPPQDAAGTQRKNHPLRLMLSEETENRITLSCYSKRH
jgi:hypothetical protein